MRESAEAKMAVFRRLVDAYARGDLDALDAIMPPDYIGHASAGDRDLNGFKDSIRHFHSLFAYAPDSFTVEHQFCDGDMVATRMTARVHARDTGTPVTMMGINLARIIDGKIVEEWNCWETLQPSP